MMSVKNQPLMMCIVLAKSDILNVQQRKLLSVMMMIIMKSGNIRVYDICVAVLWPWQRRSGGGGSVTSVISESGGWR